jgi:hypothetical protein
LLSCRALSFLFPRYGASQRIEVELNIIGDWVTGWQHIHFDEPSASRTIELYYLTPIRIVGKVELLRDEWFPDLGWIPRRDKTAAFVWKGRVAERIVAMVTKPYATEDIDIEVLGNTANHCVFLLL